MTSVVRANAGRRWLIGVLVVSLALNAFLIGAAATDLLRLFRGDHDNPHAFNFELRWLRGKLPDAGIDKVEAAIAAVQPAAERHFDRLKDLRLQLGALVAAPQPDRAAIDAQLVEIRAEFNRLLTEVQAASVDALIALPPDMRATLAPPATP